MSRKKRILIISLHFYPEQFRINDIALEFVKNNYDVKVVTGIPNYPAGRFYKGYSFWKRRKEKWNGINIQRLFIFPRFKNKITLTINYLSFIVSGYFWSKIEKEIFDYVFVFATSPILQALPAIWYSKRFSKPVYLYVQDLWPESLIIAGGIKNKYVLSVVDKIVNYIYSNSHLIFVTSQGLREEILKRNIEEDKVIYLPQYAEEFYKPIEKSTVPEFDSKVFNITFTGNVGYAQGLEILPKIAKVLLEKTSKRIVFNLIGDGRAKEKLIKIIKENNVEQMFNFVDYKPSKEIPRYISASDVVLLSYQKNELLSKYIPAKLQSYMACGKPILAIADGETKRIIEEAKCGICVEQNDINGIVEAILKLSEMKNSELQLMGYRGYEYYIKHFSKQVLIPKLLKYFE
ncbi:glycosyltransferase family 4 protein [Fervidobacterium sp. 2310opik-2]|uniref:glycosyltransferase family 4 protein n=1 Tax=Fervidobacterium sp. 2310opik-2 TaxID=1755815 RepID=UPI0013DE79F2|nr:glycosyltransferase family 4 protein [Fervidobacterium sp. 2310opik-2]KAF2960930.1 glycosyltransferase WbuB [Fervidobacterium sp. 2310opik-2]